MNQIGKKYWFYVFVMLIAAAIACGPANGEPDGKGGGGRGVSSGVDYDGTMLAEAGAYDATLDVVFEGAGDGWLYNLNVLANESQETRLRRMHVEGVNEALYPGDVDLLELGVRQYMIGPGVSASFEGAPCIIAPRDLVVDESFLMPDDFLPPSELAVAMVEAGTVEVNGVTGERFTLQNTDVGEIAVSEGEVIVADEGYVLSMDISGTLNDSYFTDTTGPVTLTYRVDDLRTEAELAVSEECAIPYPILADAVQLTWFGDLLGYETLASTDEAVAFYQQELAAEGWGVLEIPREVDGATRLTYAREGVILTIGIGRDEEMTAVSLVVER